MAMNQYGKHIEKINEHLYFMLCIFLLIVPIFNFYFEFQDLRLYVNIILILLAAILFIYKLRLGDNIFLKKQGRGLLLIVFFHQMLSLYFLPSIDTLIRVFQLTLPFLFLLIFLHIPFNKEKFSLRKCTDILIFSTTLGSLFCLVTFLLTGGFNLSNRLHNLMLGGYNAHGNFLCMVVGITIYQLARGGLRQYRAYFCSILINIFAIAATYSRGSILQLVFLLCFICFNLFEQYYKKYRFFYVFLLFFAVILLLGIFDDWVIQNTIYRMWSVTARIEIWKQALGQFFEHPYLGIGLGQFWYEAEQTDSTHNLYIQFLNEVGSIGTIMYLALSRVIYRFCNMHKKGGPTDQILKSIFLSYLFSQLVDSHFLVVQSSWILCYILILKINQK